jgi:hypothetical protein
VEDMQEVVAGGSGTLVVVPDVVEFVFVVFQRAFRNSNVGLKDP